MIKTHRDRVLYLFVGKGVPASLGGRVRCGEGRIFSLDDICRPYPATSDSREPLCGRAVRALRTGVRMFVAGAADDIAARDRGAET